MASLISLIIIFALSLLITKIASEALVHTGLSKQSARFQARSAYTGVGFTTSDLIIFRISFFYEITPPANS